MAHPTPAVAHDTVAADHLVGEEDPSQGADPREGEDTMDRPTEAPASEDAVREPIHMKRPLRIALLSPPMLAVPPATYAGTERVVAALTTELHARGHHVTLFAPGDSEVDAELVPSIERSLWSAGYQGPVDAFIDITLAEAWRQHERFDVIHSHLETGGFLFARLCPTPVVSTLHGRLDHSGMPELLEEFSDIPLVAISESQRRWSPDANWVGTIHHGLPLDQLPFSDRQGAYLAFVGRVTPEKGIADAVELARRTRLPLRMAAKVYDPHEVAHFADVVQPAIDEGIVEFLGELGQTERDALYAGAVATLMLGAWPEPFGLVAIESRATGTPIIGRRAGGVTETVEHGVTGYLVDDLIEAELAVKNVHKLSRHAVRAHVIRRFQPSRMADEYERVYRRLIEGQGVAELMDSPLTTRRPSTSGLRVSTRRAPMPVTRAAPRSRGAVVPTVEDSRP
jgi:glycosyltransferase involved in cell wall biosynthesis